MCYICKLLMFFFYNFRVFRYFFLVLKSQKSHVLADDHGSGNARGEGLAQSIVVGLEEFIETESVSKIPNEFFSRN